MQRRDPRGALRKLRAAGIGLSLAWVAACGFDPKRPFERDAPEVNEAIHEIDAGQSAPASERLGKYLGAGACENGAMAAPGAGDASAAGFDLGLALFGVAESFGHRFGEPERERDGGPTEEEKQNATLRGDKIGCARAVLDAVLASRDLSVEFAARAHYLRGNLGFLSREWDQAVKDYDQALALIPGLPADAGDSIGADAAWNRALALRNKEEDEKKDAGDDADANDADANDQDSGQDAGEDSGQDAGEDSGQDAGEDSGQDAGQDAADDAKDDGGDSGGGGDDAGQDAGDDASKNDDKDKQDEKDAGQPDAAPPTPTGASQDDRMLDQFEQAPTWQREEAKSRAGGRKVRGMADK